MNTLFAFVMIVIAENGGNGIEVEHIPFMTLEACEQAAEEIATDRRPRITPSCHPTGA
jgi:hypothetical protein